MEPISTMLLSFILQNPQSVSAGVEKMTRPGTPNVAVMQQSFADFSRGVLNCYHKTARYQVADVIQRQWPRQEQYGATQSAVVRIQYTGVSRARYMMDVAVLAKEDAFRTVVLQDTATIRYSTKCELEQWTDTTK
jgi:hypothetical protein